MKLKSRDYAVVILLPLAAFSGMFAILLLDAIHFRCGDAWICWRSVEPPKSEDWYLRLVVSLVFAISSGVPAAAVWIATRWEKKHKRLSFDNRRPETDVSAHCRMTKFGDFLP